MIASITNSLQFDVPDDFVIGSRTLYGEIFRSFIPLRLDWTISLDRGDMPTGCDAIFDVQYSTDKGSFWYSLFPVGPRLTITAGGSAYGSVTSFSAGTLEAGTWVRVVCYQIGSGTPGRGLQAILYGVE